MALTPTTKLEAVNTCLINIGESPVDNLDDGLLVDAQIALDVVDEISRDLQASGWHFNTETRTLTPTVDGTLNVPTSTLKADSVGTDASRDVVLRNVRLYDKDNNTYKFTGGIRLELVLYLDFEDLPETARRMIALRAARVFQERQLGAETISAANRSDEARAWTAMLHAEADSADYNILNNPILAKIARR